MIQVEYIETWGFEHAIRGMRNPLNSWAKSDTEFGDLPFGYNLEDTLGENDLDLMQRLYKAGHPHRKYLRQIMVSMDITAPLYWWKEFDTYKVGTTRNSCSTMHKIHSKEFTLDDFSHEHLDTLKTRVRNSDDKYCNYDYTEILAMIISALNASRTMYLETKDKKYWWQMIQLLPSSYNQRATITMNYENVFNILQYRQNHRLDEWNEFCEILIEYLPYVKEIGGFENAES